MKYDEVIDEIMNKKRFGHMKGIDVSRIMLQKMGNPDMGLNIIHIAGTNGKGSVARMMGQFLSAAGFKTGLFTSPHLVDFSERIAIDGVNISHDDVTSYGELLLYTDFDCQPTMFDYCFVMAMLYFKDADCDFVILETGLGGTYDSTNAISSAPLVSVITSIGYDHVAILGDTISEIAVNKAGIIKQGTDLVISKMPTEARNPIVTKANQLDVHVTDCTDPACIEACEIYDLSALLGYQRQNAICAITALWRLINICRDDFLEEYDKVSGYEDVRAWINALISQELERFDWPGRLSDVGPALCQAAGINERRIIIDGAHNPSGVLALKKTLQGLTDKKYIFIIGMLADKDYRKMIEEMTDLAGGFVTVSIDDNRTLTGEFLVKYISDLEDVEIQAQAAPSIPDAVRLADEMAGDEYEIAMYGSLYFVGEGNEIISDEKL